MYAQRYRWGAVLSGAIVTMLTTAALSNLGILPVYAPLYAGVWSYLVPLAIPFLLLRADLFRIVRDSGPTLLAFLIGALGTIVGVVVGFWLIPLGEDSWKLAAIFCATYIGGSMNYMAAAQAVGLQSGDVLTAGAAADNVMMTIYFLVLFLIPSIGLISRRYGSFSTESHFMSSSTKQTSNGSVGETNILNHSLAVLVATGCCVLGFVLAAFLNLAEATVLIITLSTVTLATVFPSFFHRMAGAEKLGIWIMQLFFGTIGATANIAGVLDYGPSLFAFAAITLTIHLLVILGLGRMVRISLPEILIASNANMGGPTTAAAMDAARHWDHLVIPAILCGTLGYAMATFIGLLVGNWLQVYS